MKEINNSKPILVSGATGYVAGWLIKKLFEEGITVHAAVRNPENEAKIAHLKKLAHQSKGTILFFKTDLLEEDSFKEAMEGCELVFHTASPFRAVVDDPQKDLVDPAVIGTKNILKTATQILSVKRVVVTSSCAAMYSDAIDCQLAPNGILTEEVWNTTASIDYQPYAYSKTMGEKKAWEIADQQNQWDLVVVNPSFVMGPSLSPLHNTSESLRILKQMGDGTFKDGIPNIGVGVVDVRDLGTIHYNAGFTPETKGRYIASAHNTTFFEMTSSLLNKYGELYPIPKRKIGKDDPSITDEGLKKNVDVEWKAGHSKSMKDLKATYRALEETMIDAFQVLIDAKIV